MPAETISSSTHEKGANVRVAWGAGGPDVQVRSGFGHEEGADTILAIVNEWLKCAGLDQIPGREELNKLIFKDAPADAIPKGIGFDGFHVFFHERRDVNDLIKVLKRARDGAMGKDE